MTGVLPLADLLRLRSPSAPVVMTAAGLHSEDMMNTVARGLHHALSPFPTLSPTEASAIYTSHSLFSPSRYYLGQAGQMQSSPGRRGTAA